MKTFLSSTVFCNFISCNNLFFKANSELNYTLFWCI